MNESGAGSGSGLSWALITALTGMLAIKGVSELSTVLAKVFETINGVLTNTG